MDYEKYRRLQAESPTPDLSPALRLRQEALVARARRLERRLGDPVEGLAALFDSLPPEDDVFWAEMR